MRKALRVEKLGISLLAVLSLLFTLTTVSISAGAQEKGSKPVRKQARASRQSSSEQTTPGGEMKQTGGEAKKAGTSLGRNVKRGRIVRGGKEFGQHLGRGAKHLGKGVKKAATP